MMNPTANCTKATKTWVPRPLCHMCGVCGAPAADVQHYGSTVCYSCRAFFRRSVGCGKEYGKCARDTDSCVVDQVNRTNCKKCRLQKCVEIGMKPEKVLKNRNTIKESTKASILIKESAQDFQRFIFHPEPTCLTPLSLDSSEDSSGESLNANEKDENNENSIDICALAEICVLEELKQVENSKHIKTVNDQEEPVTDNYCLLTSYISPGLELTFEEEFKIHELEVMKENLLDGFFKITLEVPHYFEHFSSVLISWSLGLCTVSPKRMLTFLNNKRNFFRNDFANGGRVSMLLNCFYVFKNVPDEVKIETFHFSVSVMALCFRAFFKVNSDKEYLIEQKKAAGLLNPAFLQAVDQIFPNNRNAIRSIDEYGLAIFKSPWAKHQSDEELFCQTMQTVGEIVKDDVNLGTLYITLVLATPGEGLSQEAKTNPSLLQVQQEITLLIYRYLKTKHNDADMASHTLNLLLKLIGDLHTCRDIHLFGRAHQASEGSCF
eukprot:GFUD01010133.1.p1 GENE.GFUD01010133.1~~GFUD01010133.1.p1  ORF type:complete len:492 (+),score=107.38 GFUD01010133.1:80-1555(+)